MRSAAGHPCCSWQAVGVEVGVSLRACPRLSTTACIVMPGRGNDSEFSEKEHHLLLSVSVAILDRRIRRIAGRAGGAPSGRRTHVVAISRRLD